MRLQASYQHHTSRNKRERPGKPTAKKKREPRNRCIDRLLLREGRRALYNLA